VAGSGAGPSRATACSCRGRSRSSPRPQTSVCRRSSTRPTASSSRRSDTTDGFELAQVDLDLRREGQLLGTRQSGWSDLQFTKLRVDHALIERARDIAAELRDEDGPWQDEADRLYTAGELAA
jgi:ATP-dependent DNA helicase RecG